MPSSAVAGFKAKLKRGDSAVGASVAASRTIGSSNSQIVISAATPGAAGNNLLCEIVVAGNNTPLTVVMGTNKVTINSATNGSAVATSTINDIIAKCYITAGFDALFDATSGAGTGAGVLAAAAVLANLAGGSDGAEAFVTVAEVKNIGGPSYSMGPIDVTSVDSNGLREFIAGLRDAGELSFGLNFIPNSSQHRQLIADWAAGSAINYRIEFGDTAGSILLLSKCLITNFGIQPDFEQAVNAQVTLKLSGTPTWTV